MDYPHLDGIIWRLRQLPEVEAILEWCYNGEPQMSAPSIPVLGLNDVGLIMRWEARSAAFFDRLAYVAGGSAVIVRAMRTIKASLTADDVRAIRLECGNAPVIDHGSQDRQDSIADVVNLIMERLLMTDSQFQRNMELELAIRRHVRSKG